MHQINVQLHSLELFFTITKTLFSSNGLCIFSNKFS